MRKNLVWLAVFLISLGTIISLFSIDYSQPISVTGVIILILGAVSSVISIFIPNKHTYKFQKSDWKEADEGGYLILIPGDTHGMGSTPEVSIFQKDSIGFNEVTGSSKTLEGGNIMIFSNITFDGKVVIS